MFLKRRHLEILVYMAKEKSKSETEEKYPEEFNTRLLELYILGFVDDGFKLNKSGKKLVELIEKISKNIESLPDVFADSEIIKMLELGVKTGYLLDSWKEILEERCLIKDGEVNEFGRELLKIYRETHPRLYINEEIIKFLNILPEVGEYRELVACSSGFKNVVNALQAMRMILISPITIGKAFSKTESAKLAIKLSKFIDKGPVVLSANEATLLRIGKGEKDVEKTLIEKGMWNGEITEFGKLALDTYDAMGVEKNKIAPTYLLDDEIEVVNTLKEIERIHKNTPSILPTYNELEKRTKVRDLGEVLHLLESKEIVRREYINGKDTYWLTKWKTIASMGTFTSDGVKALTFALSNDVPAVEWVKKAKEEGLIRNGITNKGREILKFVENLKRKPYLTKYDVAILAKIPRNYIHRDEMINLVEDYIGGDENSIRRAIGECEAKGFIEELQNNMIGLTELGKGMKKVVELAKTEDLLKVKFAITPTTFNVLKVIHDHINVFNKIWKESSEIRNYKQDEIDFIKSKLSLSEDEIKKALTLLRVVGLLGRKSITEAGKVLVSLY